MCSFRTRLCDVFVRCALVLSQNRATPGKFGWFFFWFPFQCRKGTKKRRATHMPRGEFHLVILFLSAAVLSSGVLVCCLYELFVRGGKPLFTRAWVILNHQETADLSPCFHLPGQPILGLPYFHGEFLELPGASFEIRQEKPRRALRSQVRRRGPRGPSGREGL